MIRLENLSKSFETPSGPVMAVDHVNMEVAEGEICVLLGPSGCGKTTTLKMINRLIAPSGGKILINGEDTDAIDPVELRRRIGYVIQQIGLFPNMTVEENICVVPRLLGWSEARAKARAAELLDLVALDPGTFLKRFPRELSGGQQQRVGVVRALAADPPVMLMDEPFGAIDPINREVIQDEFLKMQQTLRKTIMLVSHDIDEAVKMGDRIAIFRAGRLEQCDSPDTVLARPANSFIADFVGSDRTLKRLRLVKVGDAMDRNAAAVRETDSLELARSRMRERGEEHIVVLDAAAAPYASLTLEAAQRSGVCAEHLSPLPDPVRVDEDLRAAVSTMFAWDVSWLACVDREGRFAGVITQRGVARLLGRNGGADG